MSEQNQKFEQLVQKFSPQGRLRRAWELKGGVSAQVTALEIEQPGGQIEKWVVRRHREVDLKNNPQIAADEYSLLQILQAAGIPAPRSYFRDMSTGIFPTPYLIIEFVEGETDFAPANLDVFLRQLATHLHQIHSLDIEQFDLSFLSRQAAKYDRKFKERPAKMDDSIEEGRIREILERFWPWLQKNKTVLLHGDFWPGNILWKDGQVAAVLDWEDAGVGDPLEDLANSRLEILWSYGPEAMERFTAYYKSMASIDFTNLPFWDLCAALRPAFKISEWAADAEAEKTMRQRHRGFINAAFKFIEG